MATSERLSVTLSGGTPHIPTVLPAVWSREYSIPDDSEGLSTSGLFKKSLCVRCVARMLCEDRVLDGPASGGKGTKGRN